MKAAIIRAFGGPDVLKIEDVERPAAGVGQVLIQLRAASINPVDWKIREGYLGNWFPLPQILGRDGAGDIVAVGEGVTNFKVGDAVYGSIGSTYAEFAATSTSEIGLKPKSLSYTEAAALPIGVLTAWNALFDTAGLTAGQRVLIHGAAGGVGTFAVQLAKIKGAHVIATASASNEAFVRELGADEFIDYRTTRFEDAAKNVDVIFDTMGGETLERSYAVVKSGGTVVTVAGQPSPEKAAQYSINALSAGSKATTELLTEIAGLVDSGKLKVHVTKVLPFAEVRQGLALSQEGHTRGKIVLTM